VVFASIRGGGDCLAVGRGVVDDGWLGVAAVEVAPDVRRRGLAGAVMAALWTWGVGRDATHSYVQVRAENDGAVALYEKQGYWVHHDYRYRIEPDA
jgi:ribosomal protein S18 acetylase RimI-like enzyme